MRIAVWAEPYYIEVMKTINVRLPDRLVASIESERKRRGLSLSDVVRDRLDRAGNGPDADPLADIADLIGSVDDDLPADVSARKQHYLDLTGFGKDRPR
jgi:hypothetical protein